MGMINWSLQKIKGNAMKKMVFSANGTGNTGTKRNLDTTFKICVSHLDCHNWISQTGWLLIRVWVDFSSLKACLLGLLSTTFLLWLHIAFYLWVHIFSYKATVSVGLSPILVTSFNLIESLKILCLNTTILGVRVSIYEFGKDTVYSIIHPSQKIVSSLYCQWLP